LLEKMHYSLYSSYCSTDLQGHPSLMILSHLKKQDTASFPLKKCTFSYPHLYNPRFENVSLELHPWNFVCREHWHRTNNLCKQFSSIWPNTYPQYIRYKQTVGWMDGRETTMVPSMPTA